MDGALEEEVLVAKVLPTTRTPIPFSHQAPPPSHRTAPAHRRQRAHRPGVRIHRAATRFRLRVPGSDAPPTLRAHTSASGSLQSPIRSPHRSRPRRPCLVTGGRSHDSLPGRQRRSDAGGIPPPPPRHATPHNSPQATGGSGQAARQANARSGVWRGGGPARCAGRGARGRIRAAPSTR